MNSNRTPERAVAFCAALAETCNVGKACKAIGIGRTTAYDWRDGDAEFAAMWDRAMKVGVSALEDEAHRRAFEGTDKPLVHQGQFTPLYARDEHGKVIYDEVMRESVKDGQRVQEPVQVPRLLLDENNQPRIATLKEYSDTLAIFLLKAHDPERYRERQDVNFSGSVALHRLSDADIDAEIAALGAQVAGVLDQHEPPEDGSDLV